VGLVSRGGIGYLKLFLMPWMPNGRVGRAGGNSGRVGYVNITRIDAGGAYSLLGAFGRGFGWGKSIFGV